MSVAPRKMVAQDPADPAAFSPRTTHEQRPARVPACPPAVAVAVAVLGPAAVVIAFGAGQLSSAARIVAGAVTAAVVLVAPGFVVVAPGDQHGLALHLKAS